MNSSRIAQLSLLLSAITLAVVLAIALRTIPEPVDDTPVVRAEIEAVGAEIEALRADIDDVRTLLETGADPRAADLLAQRLDRIDASLNRLDRIEASVANIVAKLDSICAAIRSSPFAPSGFTCP